MQIARIVAATVATVATVVATLPLSAMERLPAERDSVPTLTVSGNAEVSAAPDRATVRLGAEAQADDAAQAQSRVNEIVQRTIERVRQLGIEERAIQTTGLNLSPVYAQRKPGEEPAAPRIVAYRASNVIQVTIENLPLIGKVIDAGMTSGANRLEGVSFDLRNDLTARSQALQQAAQEARTKAQTLATALDVRLVGISEVNEGGVSVIPPQPRPMAAYARAEMVSTPVQPGELRVQASVTIRYRIAPK